MDDFRKQGKLVFSSAQENMDDIISQHETYLSSEKDKEVFFSAIMNPPEPNQKLRRAVERYKKMSFDS